MPLSETKGPDVRAVQHSELLPMTCAAGFTDDCTSTDGQLRIHTTFAGTQRVRTVRGGFYGTEGRIRRRCTPAPHAHHHARSPLAATCKWWSG